MLRKLVNNNLKEAAQRMESLIASRFTEVPQQTCACGRPVVFANPRKRYTCGRCGTKWKLTVQVSKVP